jgi:hypothetical protein
MGRALILIASAAQREKAIAWIRKAPWNTRVLFKGPKRTIPQNDKMWAMLTDIATQKHWYNVKLIPDDWKLIFMAGLSRELRIVPNLDGTGFVNLNQSSSDLSKEEMSDMIELMYAWGAQHDVEWTEPSQGEEAKAA